MTSSMEIIESQEKGVTIFAITGVLDHNSAPELKRVLCPEAERAGNRILVDFSQVQYVDSAGIATLVVALKRAQASGTKLILRNVSPKTKEIFRMTQLDRVFTFWNGGEGSMEGLF